MIKEQGVSAVELLFATAISAIAIMSTATELLFIKHQSTQLLNARIAHQWLINFAEESTLVDSTGTSVITEWQKQISQDLPTAHLQLLPKTDGYGLAVTWPSQITMNLGCKQTLPNKICEQLIY